MPARVGSSQPRPAAVHGHDRQRPSGSCHAAECRRGPGSAGRPLATNRRFIASSSSASDMAQDVTEVEPTVRDAGLVTGRLGELDLAFVPDARALAVGLPVGKVPRGRGRPARAAARRWPCSASRARSPSLGDPRRRGRMRSRTARGSRPATGRARPPRRRSPSATAARMLAISGPTRSRIAPCHEVLSRVCSVRTSSRTLRHAADARRPRRRRRPTAPVRTSGSCAASGSGPGRVASGTATIRLRSASFEQVVEPVGAPPAATLIASTCSRSKPPSKTASCVQQPLACRVQQVVAPGDRRVERALPLGRIADAWSGQGQARRRGGRG